MSNKGAIKKVDPKNGTVLPTQRKSKKSTVNEDTDETSKDLRRAKMSQFLEHKGDRDVKSKVSRASLPDKKERTTRDGTRVSQSKSLSSKSSTTKSNASSSTSVHGTAMKSTASSRAKLEVREHGVKKVASSSSSSTLEKKEKKSKDKSAKGYAEKRGLSTIFIPKSTTERLSSKSTEKSMQSTRDKEKLSTTRLPDNTKTRSSSKTRSNSKTRRKSRTLSPSEVKVLHSQISSAKNRESLQSAVPKEAKTPISDENEYSYEDDFEDYESDFQECSDSEVSEESERSKNSLDLDPIELHSKERQKVVHSAENRKQEEDHMHDSGHYELAEARKRAARIESMIVNRPKTPELRQPVNKAYSEDRPSESKSLPSSTDEGFEDSRSGDFKSPPLSQISYIDFRKPKETELIEETLKQPEIKPKKVKKKTRGQELLEMIKLDTMEWSLLECSPVPYEEFIRSYGKLNTQQTYSQTGEDNLDVEVQTEEIPLQNKWTQFPIACRKELRSKEDIDMFKMEQIGVGSDEVPDTLNATAPPVDILQLNEFLNRAGRVMLTLLEERRSGGTVFRNDTQDLPFSEGYVKLSVDSVTFLAGRSVSIIHYSDVLNKVLLTIHLPVEEEIETSSKQDYVTDCCIGCVWNISEPSMPTKLFYSPSPITACCFHLTNYNIVFAGLEDGSISLWDLREDEMWHQHVTDNDNNLEWTVRTATYTTAGSIESEEHRSRIVAIRVLSKIETKFLQRNNNNFVPIQICSLDNDGFVIIWSILSNMGVSIDDLGLSQWGDIRLVRSDVIPLQPDDVRNKDNISAFLDLRVDSVDNNNLYIATNTTNVLHASYIGNRTNPPMYRMNEDDPSGATACIETCPFRKSFFLVGCDDGTVRLHSVNIEKPIVQLKDQHCQMGAIKSVQWSKTKPFTIYILDNKSQIRVWDLGVSDLHPVHTVSTEKSGRVTCMQLSPCRTEQDMANQYLALGTCTGTVEIHKLNTNFYYSKKEDLSREINIFAKYVAVW